MYYLGVDTGGTFTDFVLAHSGTGKIDSFKIRSTPQDPGEAVETGLRRLADEFGVTGDTLSRFIFGTTVATNAVLEGQGARVALVATKGTRDILEIQRQWRQRLFDLYLTKPRPLAARRHRLEIDERVDARGNIRVPLKDDDVEALVSRLADLPVEAVAISLLFSFLHPEHERRIAAAIRDRLPRLHVTVSSDVCPEFREYERTATTVMNAYTMPKVHALATRLEAALDRFEFEGVFSIVQSNGGVMTLEKARTHPINTLLSGPAAGVVAAANIGRIAGIDRVLGFDVGGTSTDISLVEDGVVRLSSEGGIAGYPVKVPQVRVHTIGAGGGSIARPELGLLKVGPQSAGASPGPAAYGSGGNEPTGTDAAVVLGYIDPDNFLNGEMALDAEAARVAIRDRVARPLGMDLYEAALAILQVQAANIVTGIRKVTVEVGKDPREFALMPFGGAGGIYAGAVAEEAGMRRIILPPYGSVLSALGVLMTDIRHDRSRTRLMPLAGATVKDVIAIFGELVGEAADEMARDRISEADIVYEFSCDMRYEGQAYEIGVALPAAGAKPVFEADRLRITFNAEHERLYGQSSPDEPVEIVSFRVAAIGRVDKIALPLIATARKLEDAPRRSRQVLFSADEGWVDCPVVDRAGLVPGDELTGPAIVEDHGASIPIRPGHSATVDSYGIIVIDTGRRVQAGRDAHETADVLP